jgi:MoaA/NifB/PqqE/SkfB family radical SAM enzyme
MRLNELLSLDEYSLLFNDFEEIGGADVVISGGGEPLLYPDYLGLVQVAASHHRNLHLYTNGLTHKYFVPDVLSKWLPGFSSIRFSLHHSARNRISAYDRFLKSLEHALLERIHHNLPVQLHVALLVDRFSDTDLLDIFRTNAIRKLDCIELRLTMPYSDQSVCRIDTARNLAVSQGVSLEQLDLRYVTEQIRVAPPTCFSLYRSIVIDPFGGYRLCCMRAHRGEDDLAYVGSVRDLSLQEALLLGKKNMAQAGEKSCSVCSFRDASFALQVLSSHE